LFVEPTDDDIRAVLEATKLDVLQVHAAQERTAEIRTRFGLPVWRAIGIGTAEDLPRDAGGIDGFVLDAQPPKGATRPGGNALAFDWALLRGWHAPVPWLLAGGLNPGNVAAAVAATGATAVDVSSGVERAKGVKDPAMIRAFIKAAKAA
jgi:phosphoribosylanthranilate isomerase